MPPKPTIVITPQKMDFESKVDEIMKLMRSFLELKSGFGEAHVKSRKLQDILKQFDIDHTNEVSNEEFAKTLDYMNIAATEDERDAVFERLDTNENGILQFKELADALFGLIPAPQANPEVRAVVKKFREKMLQRAGDQGLRGLYRTLSIMDKNHNNSLSKEEIFNGLQRYGIPCTLADADILVKFLDRDGSGSVSITEFLRAMRGHMVRKRRKLVAMAYEILDIDMNEQVTLAEIAKAYDVTGHPAVKKGDKSPDQVLKEFIAGWDKSGDGTVTWAEFLDYYKDISASIERDDYFELMMRNCWHISGGDGSAENTSCRRVLVTHKDGHQSIEEIVNDLGIGPKDLDKMKAALASQGITDIVKIELYS